MQNWIVWNKAAFDIETVVLLLNWIVWRRTVYMHKMDSALIAYNGWCAIKAKQTKSEN